MAFEIIVIGTSLGGLKALQMLFNALPEDFLLPLAVVLHRQKESDDFLVGLLQKRSALQVREAEDKLPIESGNIYIAPSNYHLLIDHGKFALSTDPLVSMARPSIDVLFESCADAYGARAIGLILTGGGRDGTHGLTKIQQLGGTIIVENPKTAQSADMPESAIAATATDQVFQLAEIGAVLKKMDSKSNPAAISKSAGGFSL